MIQKDLGFVLRRYNFRETSLITTLYTYRFGKIKGIFKGFYTSKKEFSSPLDIFSLNEFVFYPKKSEIWLISHTDLVSDFSYLRKNIEKAKISAFLFNLLDKTLPLWDSNQYIFSLVNSCLNCLSEEPELKILYIFLIKFLTFSGFKPELNHCVSCEKLLNNEFSFSVVKGGLVCCDCARKVKDAKRINKQVCRSLLYIQNTEFSLARRLKIDKACEEEIFYILERFLNYHFDFYDLGNLNIFPLHRQLAL